MGAADAAWPFPTYIVAYAAVDLFDYSGPAQSLIRWLLGVQSARDYWFPEVRSLPGSILVMSFVLYPYVFLTTRATFLMQSACALDVSRTLGAGPVCDCFLPWLCLWPVRPSSSGLRSP